MPKSDEQAIAMARYEDQLTQDQLGGLFEAEVPHAALDPQLVNATAAALERTIPKLAGGQLPQDYRMPRVPPRAPTKLPGPVYAELSLLETYLGSDQISARHAASSDEGLQNALAIVQSLGGARAPAAAPPRAARAEAPPVPARRQSAEGSYVVQPGDTWLSIGKRIGVNPVALMRGNRVDFGPGGQAPPAPVGATIWIPR